MVTSEHPNQRPPRFMGCAFAAVGTVICLAGLGFGAWSLRDSFDTQGVNGTVVALEDQQDAEGHSYFPIVEYEVDGTRHRIKGRIGFKPPAHDIGQTVHILYHKDQPSQGAIDSFLDRWLFPLVFSLGGGLFAVIGFVMLWSRRQPSDEQAIPHAADDGNR